MSSTTSRSVIGLVLSAAVMAGMGACALAEDATLGAGSISSAGNPQSEGMPLPSPASPSSSPRDPAPAPALIPGPDAPDPAAPDGPAGTDAGTGAPGAEADPLVPAARAALGQLEIKGRAPKTGYDRALFGQAWSDDVGVAFGHNGCDTRNDILKRDLRDITLRPGSNDCVVLTGVLDGPYTGERIEFERGQGTSSLVQIDHVVALSDGWQKGAQQLTLEQRRDFANDPLNLLAVSGWVNQQKGAGDTATWLPPRREFRCSYVSRQVLVKERYGLWVTQAERDAMDRVLAGC